MATDRLKGFSKRQERVALHEEIPHSRTAAWSSAILLRHGRLANRGHTVNLGAWWHGLLATPFSSSGTIRKTEVSRTSDKVRPFPQQRVTTTEGNWYARPSVIQLPSMRAADHDRTNMSLIRITCLTAIAAVGTCVVGQAQSQSRQAPLEVQSPGWQATPQQAEDPPVESRLVLPDEQPTLASGWPESTPSVWAETYPSTSGRCRSCATVGCNGPGCRYANCGCSDCPRAFWMDLHYLIWWTKGQNIPVLATTSDPATGGILPDAEILFGGERPVGDARFGALLELGWWQDPAHDVGFGGSFFAKGTDDFSFFAASDADGNPVLARPFFDVETRSEEARLVASPNIVSGQLRIHSDSDVLGGTAYIRRRLLSLGPCRRLDLLLGYQFTRIDEDIRFEEQTVDIDPNNPINDGTTFDIEESFVTQNEFHGALIGVRYDAYRGPWMLSMSGKLGLGNMHERMRIRGMTTITDPLAPPPITSEGGLLALPSNIGDFSRDEFAFSPQLNINLSYCVWCNVRLTVGYSLLYWDEVARAGEQIDRNLNLSQLGASPNGPTAPLPNFRSGDLWLQGINVGLNWQF